MANTKEDFPQSSKAIFGERNCDRKKSQTLFESQESVFQKISSVFSQSSNSTNIGDTAENLLQPMDTEVYNAELETSISTYDLRTRTVIKQPRKRLFSEENFKSDIPKTPRLEKTTPSERSFGENDIAMEDCSQESVSMLEGAYQNNTKNEFPELIETCMDSEFEVISIYSENEEGEPIEDSNEKAFMVENSTQTAFTIPVTELNHPREIEIAKHANFINSVVKLKALLSSKEPVPDKKLWDILHNTMEREKTSCEDFGESEDGQTIPKETIGYLIRSSDMDIVFGETVRALLDHLDFVFEDDFLKIASCWKDSAYELAVTMLSEAVDGEAGIWKMVDSFLCKKIGSVLKDGGKSKVDSSNTSNLVLESKANVIISLCQSAHLSYTAINFIIKKLSKLKTVKLNSGSLTEKISWAYLTKNSYFLLRILESALNILKDKVSKGKIEDVLAKKTEQKNYNVLEMWKKHWRKNEVSVEKKTGHDWEVVVSRWCTDLDEVSMHCVNYIPVLSMAVQRCGMLAKEILKLCHPEIMDNKPGSSTSRQFAQAVSTITKY